MPRGHCVLSTSQIVLIFSFLVGSAPDSIFSFPVGSAAQFTSQTVLIFSFLVGSG